MSEQIFQWPKWMGYPLVEGYGAEIVDTRVKTEMEIGSTFRIEFDTDQLTANCSMFLQNLQADWFESFEKSLLKQGSKWFQLPLWVGGKLLPHTVRFKERPKLVEKNYQYTTYSFTLDIARREDMMPDNFVSFLFELDPYEFIRGSDMLQICVNEMFPIALPFVSN
jgi:hypothetical protein